jgi:two-component sensor histidine kinase
MRLQADSAEDPSTRTKLRESENRIMSMALIHEQLYQSELFTRIDFADYVETVVLHRRQQRGAGSGGPAFRIEAQPVSLDLIAAIPLGLVLNELLTRCLDGERGPGEGGIVVVSLSADHGNKVTLSLRDEGSGSFEESLGEGASALGLQLVRSLVDQLGGSYRVERGSLAIVEFSSG